MDPRITERLARIATDVLGRLRASVDDSRAKLQAERALLEARLDEIDGELQALRGVDAQLSVMAVDVEDIQKIAGGEG